MSIVVLITFIIEAILGIGSCIAIIGYLFGIIGFKIMRKVKYGKSLYE